MAIPSPVLPLRACLLSGGASRRMGQDKLPFQARDLSEQVPPKINA